MKRTNFNGNEFNENISKGEMNMFKTFINKLTGHYDKRNEKEYLKQEWQEIHDSLYEKYMEEGLGRVQSNREASRKAVEILVKERIEYQFNNLPFDGRSRVARKMFKKLNYKLAKKAFYNSDSLSDIRIYLEDKYDISSKILATHFVYFVILFSLVNAILVFTLPIEITFSANYTIGVILIIAIYGILELCSLTR